jgi:mannose-6-phosphate isomerase-like protein (cupin superfamily)
MSTNPAIGRTASGASVVDHRSVQHFEMAGNHMYGLATRARGARQVEVWFTNIDVDAATPVHRHSDEEVVVVLKGRGEARRIGVETITFEAPCTLILPADELHQLANCGSVAIEAFACMPVASKVFDEHGIEMALPWRE